MWLALWPFLGGYTSLPPYPGYWLSIKCHWAILSIDTSPLVRRISSSDKRLTCLFCLVRDLCKNEWANEGNFFLFLGLPNEVDFALNVCCILSMEGQESLRLLSHRNLMDLLLAHAGLFAEQSSLLPLYETHWSPANNRNFVKVGTW